MERRLRLRESADIKRVRGRGMAVAEGPFVVRVLPNRLDPPQNRYSVVAGKKQGNAVKRNRVKRLAREALRHLDPLLVTGIDVLVLVRGKAEEVPDYATARALLDRVVVRAGLLAPSGGHGANARAGDPPRRHTSDEIQGPADASRPPGVASTGRERPPRVVGEGPAPSRVVSEKEVREPARPSRQDRQAAREGTGPSPTTDDRPDAPGRRGGAA